MLPRRKVLLLRAAATAKVQRKGGVGTYWLESFSSLAFRNVHHESLQILCETLDFRLVAREGGGGGVSDSPLRCLISSAQKLKERK